jgi:hypothetical protein
MRPSPGPADQPHELVEVVRGLEAEDQQVRRVAAAPRSLEGRLPHLEGKLSHLGPAGGLLQSRGRPPHAKRRGIVAGVCRGAWTRVIADQFRLLALQTCQGHSGSMNILAN